jgi:hypothetical protein
VADAEKLGKVYFDQELAFVDPSIDIDNGRSSICEECCEGSRLILILPRIFLAHSYVSHST